MSRQPVVLEYSFRQEPRANASTMEGGRRYARSNRLVHSGVWSWPPPSNHPPWFNTSELEGVKQKPRRQDQSEIEVCATVDFIESHRYRPPLCDNQEGSEEDQPQRHEEVTRPARGLQFPPHQKTRQDPEQRGEYRKIPRPPPRHCSSCTLLPYPSRACMRVIKLGVAILPSTSNFFCVDEGDCCGVMGSRRMKTRRSFSDRRDIQTAG